LFLIAASAWFVLPYAIKQIQIRRLRRRCQAEHSIVLTYDDGPGTHLTRAILDILRDRNAHATFFPLGHKLGQSKELAARIIGAGHELGSHSYAHLHPWKWDPVSVFLDTQKGMRAVRTVTDCQLFRAPYGKLTLGSMIQVRFHGCRQSWWTIDSTDTWKRPIGVTEILDRVRAQGGGVVLLHDLDRPAQPEREKFVLDLTRGLLDLAADEGFRICRLGDVIRR
jgi:peptidoglycan/xylan/chitin deacetylase (PgdA/CDA1 family)